MLEHKKDDLKAWLFLAPMLISFAIWTFFPLFNTIAIAFSPNYVFQWGQWGSPGLDAFREVLTNEHFWRGVMNSAIMVVMIVPVSMTIALLIAVGIYSIPKVKGAFQTIFFLPYVTNTMAFGLVFLALFNPNQSGFVNTMLGWFGVNPIAWTPGDGPVSFWHGMFVISVSSIWNRLPFMILVFIGGLQGIDKQYYQAAQIDGANKKRVFRRITLPLLSPMLFFIATISLIGAFQSYLSIVALFGDYMGNGGDRMFITAVGFIFLNFNQAVNGGLNEAHFLPIAAASAVIVFIMIMILTLIKTRVSKKRVHY